MTTEDGIATRASAGDALAPLAVYSNAPVPEAIVRWMHSRGDVAPVPYLDFPELAPPAADVLIVIGPREFAAASALVGEVLPTRQLQAGVHLSVASRQLDVDIALLRAHLGDISVDEVVDLGEQFIFTVSSADTHGNLPETLWTLTRSGERLNTALDVPLRDAQLPASPVAPESQPGEVPARRRRPHWTRNRVLGATLAIAAVALCAAAVLLWDDPGVAGPVAACLCAAAVAALLALLTRRALRARGK